MPGGVGSIYAEATLDITKFTAAASQLGGEAGKIAKAAEKAGAGLEKAKARLDDLSAGLGTAQSQLSSANAAFDVSAKALAEMQEKAESAAQSAAKLGDAYEKAKKSFGETSLQAFEAQKEYKAASDAADELATSVDNQQQKVDKSAATLDKATLSVKKYESEIKQTKGRISGFENQIAGLNNQLLNMGSASATATKKGLENMLRTTITSSGESMGTFAMRAAGVDTTSFLGILGSRGIGRAIATLGKALPTVGLGMLAVGAAAGVAGYAIYKAADKAADGVDLWEKAYEGVDAERTTKFTQTVEAGIELKDTGLSEQVNSIYDQIGKALTDGKPDTTAVVSEIQEASKGMFSDVRAKIQEWYDAEMANLDLSTTAGVQKAQELTLEYYGLIDSVNQLDENTAGWIASYAGKSTAECEAALTTLETYEDELERLAGRADELTAILQSNQAAAFTTVKSGITTDETTVANATAYVQYDYSVRLRHAEEDYEAEMAALWQEYQDKLQAAADEQEKLTIEAEYESKIRQATGDYAATKAELTSEYNQMLADVMQGVAEAASRSDPRLAAAIQQAITGDFSKLKDLQLDNPALAAAMKGFVESGVLDGVTGADLSTAEGQLEAMIHLLAQGTSEYAQGAFEKLAIRETEGLVGVLGSIWDGGATEAKDPVQRISEFADRTEAAVEKLNQTGSKLDLNNIQELFRTAFDYESTTQTGGTVTGLERLVTFIDAVNAAASAGNLDTAQLQQYGATISDILLVLDSMETAGGAENLDFLAKLSTALNTLGYSTDYSNVVSVLHEIWDAWAPLAAADADGGISLPVEVDVNEKGIPTPTLEQLAQLGYYKPDEPVEVEVPVTPIIQVNENGVPVPTLEQLAEMGYYTPEEPVEVEIPIKPKLPTPEELAQIYGPIGAGATQGVAQGMPDGKPAIDSASDTVASFTFDSLKSSFQENSPSELTKPIGTDITAGVAEGMLDTSSVTAAAAQVSADAISALRSSMAGSNAVGLNFSRGLAAGILAGRSGVISAAASVARAAAAAAKSELDINSPSGVTWDYGEDFDMGFIKGIQQLTPKIDDAVREALYIEPPHGAAYGGYSAPTPVAQASVAIDYDALAEAMSAVQMRMYMNDRAVAEATANATARAQNSRSRSIALGYGTKGRR